MTDALREAVRSTASAICAAAVWSGRRPEEVTLVAASKTVAPLSLSEVIAAGLTVFGENRVQEAKKRWLTLRAEHPEVWLHLVGPLQSNKVNVAVGLFDVSQTLDRLKLAAFLARLRRRRLDPARALYVQVNLGEEPQKSGVPRWTARGSSTLPRRTRRAPLGGLRAQGNRPHLGDPEPYFLRLDEMCARLRLAHCSTGMSADYPFAIRCGVTVVRVGSALFGQRVYS